MCEKYLLRIILMDPYILQCFGKTQMRLHQKTEINLPDAINESKIL